MKGLTLDQYKEVIEFTQQHHRFALYIFDEERNQRKINFPNLPSSHGFGIKYIDSCYDSRSKTIWSVTFRGAGVCLNTSHYAGYVKPINFKYTTLYDWCMDYLKGNWEATDEFINK